MSLALHRSFEIDSPTLDSAPEYCAYQQFRLEVIAGPDLGAACVSTDVRVVVGSAQGADLILCDSSVAPYQCEIVVHSDSINIVDLAGRKSTLVNELQVEKAHLSGPVVIRVGDTEIQFEPVAAHVHKRRTRETSFENLVGDSPAMRELFVALEGMADCEVPVLLEGEAAVGHAAVAKAIHEHSARRAGSFHVVDCSASHEIVERGLIRAFEQAAGGTLYLQHVSELSEDLQSRLLRVFRNGGPGAVADLRVMSSSAVDLRVRVNEGHFDPRLYVHLSGETARVPPIRERKADLPRLVTQILEQLGAGESIATGMSETLGRLQRYDWPGNLRELRDHLERCARPDSALPPQDRAANLNLSAEAPPSPDVDISRPIKAGREEWIKHFERMYLADVLESQGGNVTRAAKAAGVDRGHFYRLMMRCGLR